MKYLLLISSICCCFQAWSQTALSLEDAINMALQKNYSIAISKNRLKIAENNVTKGNAGFLPTVTVTAGDNISAVNSKQEFANGTSQSKDIALSNGFNAGLALNWTLYDGRKMFATLDKLKELQSIGEINLEIQTIETVYEVMQAYFNIVRQQQQLKVLNDALPVYEERVRLADTRLNIGKGNKLDLVQAQMDMNKQKSGITNQLIQIETARITLRNLIQMQDSIPFEVTDTISLSNTPDLITLQQKAIEKNQNISLALKNIGVSMLTLKEIESQKLPRIGLNGAFNFNRTDNQAGFVLQNQAAGLNAGVSASWIIFDGHNTSRQIENAKLDILNSQLQKQDLEVNLRNMVASAWKQYQGAIELLKFEEQNIAIAQEGMEIALERYRLGNTTALELKEFQRTYEEAQNRVIDARFQAKLAEIDLYKLSGALIR